MNHHAVFSRRGARGGVALATIDFDEGGRTVGRLVGTDKPAFGMRVSAVFHDHADWTELRFQPSTSKAG